MTAEGPNIADNDSIVGQNHGHFFVKKTFTKNGYCHHCCEKIWGMLTQGYFCEVCNLICHDRCVRSIVSCCCDMALQLIKNPVAHTWSEPQHIKRHFCCVCRKRTDDTSCCECEVCNYFIHVDCRDLAVSDCREASTFVPSLDRFTYNQYHHMREGNLPKDARCGVCKKGCYTLECFTGLRCMWCDTSVHSACYRQMKKECDFGPLRKIMLPPSSVTIPRTELPMDQLLNIHHGGADRKLSSPSRANDEFANNVSEEKESDEYEILRMFDGNNSLRTQAYRSTPVPKTATVDQIRDIAMRRFHIYDANKENYYVTQAPHETGDEEELLEDPIPLRNLKRPEGRRAQIFIRYRDDPEKAAVKVYGGWIVRNEWKEAVKKIFKRK